MREKLGDAVSSILFLLGLLGSVFLGFWAVVFAVQVGLRPLLAVLVLGSLLFAAGALFFGYLLWSTFVWPRVWRPPAVTKPNPDWLVAQLSALPTVRTASATSSGDSWTLTVDAADPDLLAGQLLEVAWFESSFVPGRVTIEFADARKLDILLTPRLGRSTLASGTTLVILRGDFERVFGQHPLAT